MATEHTCPHSDQPHGVYIMMALPSPYGFPSSSIPEMIIADNHRDAERFLKHIPYTNNVIWGRAFRSDNEAYQCIFKSGPAYFIKRAPLPQYENLYGD